MLDNNLNLFLSNFSSNLPRTLNRIKYLLEKLNNPQKKIENVKKYSFTSELIDNFFVQARKSYPEGLGSLYTYERQVPEIAETKINGLKNFYGVKSKIGLEFFEVHKAADVHHRKECELLLDSMTTDEQEKAEKAALSTAKYLWNFLTGMSEKHNLAVAA